MDPRFDLNLRSYAAIAESHAHDHHQAVFPLSGAMELETALGGSRVTRDKVAVITAGETHAFSCLVENAFLVVDVATGPRHSLNALWDAASSRPLFRLEQDLSQLTRFAALDPKVLQRSGAARESLALLLMQGLASQLGVLEPGEPESLRRARIFIGQNLGAPIGLKEVAAAAGSSVSKLKRAFHRWHGTSPGRYLAEARLRQAEALITGSDLPLAQIALACGFSEQSALNRAMYRAGMTSPARLRREAQGAERPT